MPTRVTADSSSTTEARVLQVQELLGPAPEVADHTCVRAAREVAAQWAADAQEVDAASATGHGVTRARVDLAARAGLLGVTAPAGLGGAGAPAPVQRAVTELLAGACGTTWFVTAQHAMPLAAVVAGREPVASRWSRPLATGSTLAATAVSHLRRPGPPPVRVERDPRGRGWRVAGHVGWLTSWGLADVLLLGARAGDDLVLALVPAREAAGLRAGALMRLAAMQGTRTTTLDLDGLRVDDDDVVDVVEAAGWLEVDAARTANVVPAVFGLLAVVCETLVRASSRPGAGRAGEVGLRAAEQGASLRRRAYRLLDEVPPAEEVDLRLRLRAESLQLLVQTSGALVAAGAGASMSLHHPAQRWAREALFHLVQAQTAAVREETLAVWAEGLSAPGRAPSPTP